MTVRVNNAGLILLGPFLPKFFEGLFLTENNSFVR